LKEVKEGGVGEGAVSEFAFGCRESAKVGRRLGEKGESEKLRHKTGKDYYAKLQRGKHCGLCPRKRVLTPTNTLNEILEKKGKKASNQGREESSQKKRKEGLTKEHRKELTAVCKPRQSSEIRHRCSAQPLSGTHAPVK